MFGVDWSLTLAYCRILEIGSHSGSSSEKVKVKDKGRARARDTATSMNMTVDLGTGHLRGHKMERRKSLKSAKK